MALLAVGRFRVSLAELATTGLEHAATEQFERARSVVPANAPDHFALASSTPLRDDLRDLLHYEARELPSIRGRDDWVASTLLQAASVTGTNASDADMARVHRYTEQTQRGDRLVQTAIKTGATHVVSNDEAVAPVGGLDYSCLDGSGGSTRAVSLSRFVEECVERDDFFSRRYPA